MQAETYSTATLRIRQRRPVHQAITLGAALVAGAVYVSTHFASWRAPHLDETPALAMAPNVTHPYGDLVFFNAEPTQAPPATLSTRKPLIEIDPEKNEALAQAPTAEPRNATAERPTPLPPPRPQALAASPQQTSPRARRDAPIAAPAQTADNRGLFERIFNIQPQEQQTALAYAAPQDGAISNPLRGAMQMPMSVVDGSTAVYDISARTVFMPNGEKLEAHSGLGDLLDDPNRVHVKNRGATPPNVYDLTLRESLFHGVRAIRLNPVNASDMFGRDGMLAHTYMLGPKGDSNGCVSFKDYDRFLNAFLSGDVKRLVVVQRRA